MDVELTSGSPSHRLGSWHPAMRPDSQEANCLDELQKLQSAQQPSTYQNNSPLPAPQPDLPSPLLEPPAFLSSGQPPDLDSPQLSLKQSRNPSFHTEAVSIEDAGHNHDERKMGDGKDHATFGRTSEILDVKDTSQLSHSHNSGQVDDILFPEYLSLANEEAHKLTSSNLSDKEKFGIEWDANQHYMGISKDDSTYRSNSFPPVPPLHQANALPHHQLSRSQAEAIMEEDQNNEHLEKLETAYPFSKFDKDEAIPQNEYVFDEYEDKGFLANSSAIHEANVPSPGDEEIRFQEGLPLVPSKSSENQPIERIHQAVDELPASPQWFGAGDEDAFSKELSTSPKASSFFKPQPLDRKSTTQVLESLQYVPQITADLELDRSIDQPSHADLAGGALKALTTNTNSQPHAEIGVPEKTLDLESSQVAKNPQEQDLVAMWQAALADDELLDDNDTSLDPSNFFADDGEGFLEEKVGQVNDEGPLQPQFSSDPQPVFGKDIVHGFGNPNTKLSNQVGLSQGNYLPSSAQPQHDPSSGYFLHQTPATAPRSMMQLSPTTSQPLAGLSGPQGQWNYSSNSVPARPNLTASAQSFSDKSKGGYTSPYDLPMDVMRPKKRNHPQQKQPASDARSLSQSQPPPPPRSSSVSSHVTPSTVEPRPPMPQISRANTSVSGLDLRTPSENIANSALASQRSVGSFFEELPSKPRPLSSKGKPIPGLGQQNQNSPMAFQNPPAQQMPLSQRSASSSSSYQLLPPERMGLYSNVPKQDATRQVPVSNPRYSPAPISQNGAPPARNRYTSSPSGVSRPAPPSQSMSFQPRTSSPLAQNSSSQHYQRNSAGDIPRDPSHQNMHPESKTSRDSFVDRQYQADTKIIANQRGISQPKAGRDVLPDSPQFVQPYPPLPEPRYAPNGRPSLKPYPPQNSRKDYLLHNNIPLSDNFASQNNQDPIMNLSNETCFRPPQRSQTQSPGAVRSKNGPFQRPASVNHQATPSYTNPPYVAASNQSDLRSRRFSQRFNYITPTDGRELDPLERWKGCPIISFGFGGTIVTCFPKQIPRYAAGQSTPMLKCSPGEVKLSIGKVVSPEENIVTFPGPLRSKSKKKEVLDWLQKRVIQFESSQAHFPLNSMQPNPHKRLEEKILLWKMLQILVEHDGLIEGSPGVISAARSLLLPELAPSNSEHISSYSPDHDLLGISKHGGSNNMGEPVNTEALEALRKLLLQGEREKAVWYAVDQRLWDHAMLLSSTLESKLWKQVLQEFVRQEVKTFGRNTESLASLYQIFAGNWEESIDELVPPSARAGLQMVSKIPGAGPTKNALDGLERWRETLTLILSNRTPDDSKALVALGQLLSNYGRTEAAHICYIFAKLPGLFGGANDPQTGVVLLGADHVQFPFDYNRDFDGILLTEIYDFATTVLTSSTTASVSPHLQSYKLYHAMLLAENGHRSEAQQYCDAITTALKSTTKLSPYYHSLLFGALEDLIERLRQAPKDGSASWMSKPSMDKVSGSVWAKFNQFIAGDESDNGSAVSGKAHDQDGAGPFARVAGDSPSVSRMPSSSELYSNYPVGGEIAGIAPATNLATSRYAPSGQYAPAGQYTPRSSLEQAGSWSSHEPRRQSDGDSLRPVLPHQQHQPRNNSAAGMSQEPSPNSYKPPSQPLAHSPQSQSYIPTPPSQPNHMPVAPQDEPSLSLYEDSYRPTPPPKDEPLHQSYALNEHRLSSEYEPPHLESNHSSGYEPPNPDLNHSGYEPPHSDYNSSGYEPPSYSYEPPSYNPDAADDTESPLEEKPKKKSFIDDDEDHDFEAREVAFRKEEKAKKDRDVDEAFRKAAEADAQKDPKLGTKKSWFGGWLGGKKDGDSNNAAPSNAPIRAKLGEESSFYYDNDLKKWVNKKAGAATTETSAPKPPPPKGPPSRAVSAAAAPPPSSATPPVPSLPTAYTAPMQPGMTPPINISKPPTSISLSSSPIPTPSPSRSFSSAAALPSTTEEPAPPLPRISALPGIDSEPGPPSRPATGMSGISNASSIDDLLGQPQPRKGGTVRKGKKGRYIDPISK